MNSKEDNVVEAEEGVFPSLAYVDAQVTACFARSVLITFKKGMMTSEAAVNLLEIHMNERVKVAANTKIIENAILNILGKPLRILGRTCTHISWDDMV